MRSAGHVTVWASGEGRVRVHTGTASQLGSILKREERLGGGMRTTENKGGGKEELVCLELDEKVVLSLSSIARPTWRHLPSLVLIPEFGKVK